MGDEFILGKHGGARRKGEHGAVGTLSKRGSNSRRYIVLRLRRDGFTELADAVTTGRMSAWAARQRAGWPPWEVRRRELDARERTEQKADARLRTVEALIG